MNNKTSVIVEISGGSVIALHGSEDINIHVVDWDNKGNEPTSWEHGCKSPLGVDRLIDKNINYYLNEILNA